MDYELSIENDTYLYACVVNEKLLEMNSIAEKNFDNLYKTVS